MLSNLVYTLQSDQQHSPAILCHALIGLGKVGNAAEHLPLIAPFLDARWEQSVRLAAIDAVSNLGGEEAIDRLIALLGDSDIIVRWEAQAALDRLLVGTELVGTDSAVAESAPATPDDEPYFDDSPF
ncbi:MAG: HEAT repeat domain-containing protein [Chloroflexi bacterium]|nr:HEAT repeat domain-containing protein [Chloroflexota bacterium]